MFETPCAGGDIRVFRDHGDGLQTPILEELPTHDHRCSGKVVACEHGSGGAFAFGRDHAEIESVVLDADVQAQPLESRNGQQWRIALAHW